MYLRRRFFLICFLWVVMLRSAIGASLDGKIVELATGNPVPNSIVSIFPRTIVADEFARPKLEPFHDGDPLANVVSDADGRFHVETSAEFVALRVERAGFAPYFNALVRVKASGDSITIELISENPSVAEANLLEWRRAEAQAAARVDSDPPPLDHANLFAAAQPIVPTDVWVVNLEGYTGLMNLDEFIAGVVSREMGDGFPYEALKAQSVAARTYALARLRDRGQANGGQAYTSALGSRSSASAFNSSGVALTYASSYITAFFSARCNGDFTLDSEDGLSGLSTCAVGGLTGGRFIAYLRKVPCSGHVNCSQTSEQCCDVTVDGRLQHIYGHGVGLCQRGAQNFAGRDGFNWQAILNRFYTSVTTLPGNQVRLGDRIELITTANRRTSPCAGTATSTALGSKGTLIAGPQTIPCTLISGTSYLTWWRIAFDNGARAWVAEDFFKKSPAVQAQPSLSLAIASTLAPSTVQITAVSRQNLRVVLDQSSDLKTWSPLATNTVAATGSATFSASRTAAQRYFRARLQLPDNAP